MDLHIEHLPVSDKLFTCMPDELQSFKDEFKPAGFFSLKHTFRKEENGRWRQRCLLTAEDMQATYDQFQYTVDHIRGTHRHRVRQ